MENIIIWGLRNPIKTILVAVSLCFVGITAINSYTIVQPGNAKVGTYFGKVQNNVLTEGFHIVNPLVSFDIYSTKDFTVNYDNIKVPAQDKMKSRMDLAVTLNVDPSSLPRMKREAGSLQDAYTKYVVPHIYSLLRECGKGVEQSQDFFKNEVQVEMQEFMLTALREQLAPLGFNVKVALFSDISLPPLVQRAIEQTKDREEKVNQERAQLEIIALEQQKAVKVAEAKRDAAVSNAEGIRTLANAAAYKISTVAKAQAKANRELAKSVTPTLVEYIRANGWDGKYPTTMLAPGTGTLVNLK